jgi:hypothetical protein
MTKQIEYLESVKPLDDGFPKDFVDPDPKVVGKASVILAASMPLVSRLCNLHKRSGVTR